MFVLMNCFPYACFMVVMSPLIYVHQLVSVRAHTYFHTSSMTVLLCTVRILIWMVLVGKGSLPYAYGPKLIFTIGLDDNQNN